MLASYTVTTDPAELAEATGDHPFLLLHKGTGRAYVGREATVWCRAPGRPGDPDRPLRVGGLGDGPEAIDLVAQLAAAGDIPPGTRVELPRMDHALVLAAFPGVSIVDWDLRWLTTEPPAVAGEERVVRLDERDHDQINAVLDDSLPGAHHRPGSPRIRRWYGIRDGASLVAVAADGSTSRFGFLNSIGVRSDRHGQGLGSALTARIARDLCADHRTVMLGVWADNPRASQLYRRLGFVGELLVTAFTVL